MSGQSPRYTLPCSSGSSVRQGGALGDRLAVSQSISGSTSDEGETSLSNRTDGRLAATYPDRGRSGSRPCNLSRRPGVATLVQDVVWRFRLEGTRQGVTATRRYGRRNHAPFSGPAGSNRTEQAYHPAHGSAPIQPHLDRPSSRAGYRRRAYPCLTARLRRQRGGSLRR
jgi:hypothetical protein